jgi:hypothetical protein
VFWTVLGNETWRDYEVELIAGVIKWWSSAPDIPAPSQPVIILLSVSYAPYQPTMVERLLGAPLQSPIAVQLMALAAQDESAICLRVLPELVSLSLSEVEDWVRENMQPEEADDVLFVLRATFTGRRKDAEQRVRQMSRLKEKETTLDFLESLLRCRNRSGRLPMGPLADLLKKLYKAENVLRSI